MTASSLDDVDLVILTIARTVVANAEYFAELDGIVGDGDFGYSLRSGFEVVLREYKTFDRSSVGSVLKAVGVVLSRKVGGVSGPIWGTAFLRAGAAAGDKSALTGSDVIDIMRAGIAGIMQRGGASVGEKTLLDALVPAVDVLELGIGGGKGRDDHGAKALQEAADAASRAAEQTRRLVAKRGRAAYTGERSVGSVDAGAAAVGVIFERISVAWRVAHVSHRQE
jgi:dihydroxyacetone kinase phosphoprotein-dependent L subunit